MRHFSSSYVNWLIYIALIVTWLIIYLIMNWPLFFTTAGIADPKQQHESKVAVSSPTQVKSYPYSLDGEQIAISLSIPSQLVVNLAVQLIKAGGVVLAFNAKTESWYVLDDTQMKWKQFTSTLSMSSFKARDMVAYRSRLGAERFSRLVFMYPNQIWQQLEVIAQKQSANGNTPNFTVGLKQQVITITEVNANIDILF